MSEHDFGSDPWLDAKLRNVPIPVGLAAKLTQISSASPGQTAPISPDAQLDSILAGVPVPDTLIPRLLGIPSEARRVALHRAERRRRLHLPELAVAAAVLVAAGVFYLGSLWGEHNTLSNLAEKNPSGIDAPSDLVRDDGPTQPLDSHPNALTPSTDQLVGRDAVSPGTVGADNSVHQDTTVPIVPPGDFEPVRSPFDGPVFGKDPAVDVLPELQSISLASAHGLAPPRVAGYDLLFQLKHGDHPFVSPSAAKELATLNIPLQTSTLSYDSWKNVIRRGQLPAPDAIRTEHFLAAMRYGFPPPSDGMLALRTAAGPAPSEPAGMRLLQIGVQAGAAPTAHPPVHVTLALESSDAMLRSGRLEMARDAVLDVCRGLAREDRISIVAFGQRAELLIADAPASEVAKIDASLQSLAAGGGINLVAGLQQACSATRRASNHDHQHLVIITSSPIELPESASTQLSEALVACTSAGVKLSAFTLEEQADAGSQYAELIQAAKGRLIPASKAGELHFGLLELLTGQSQTVANKASLKLVFNPQAVDRYRLVGHEARTVTAPEFASLQVDLRSGESATALVELWLKPTGGDDVATAELSWQDARTGAAGQARQRISRLQFAKTFAETPASLQSAYLAAQTAEALRGSYYATPARTLRNVQQLAGAMSLEAQSQPDLQELLRLVGDSLELQGRSSSPRAAAAPQPEAAPSQDP